MAGLVEARVAVEDFLAQKNVLQELAAGLDRLPGAREGPALRAQRGEHHAAPERVHAEELDGLPDDGRRAWP